VTGGALDAVDTAGAEADRVADLGDVGHGVGDGGEDELDVQLGQAGAASGLPLLVRRFCGPASPSRAGRSLRVFCCAAVLAFLPAFAIVEAFANLTPARPTYKFVFCIAQGWSDASAGCGQAPGQSTGGLPWAGEIALLLLTAGYVGVILFLTSRRSRVTRGTLSGIPEVLLVTRRQPGTGPGRGGIEHLIG
jgi:hypothetical protein